MIAPVSPEWREAQREGIARARARRSKDRATAKKERSETLRALLSSSAAGEVAKFIPHAGFGAAVALAANDPYKMSLLLMLPFRPMEAFRLEGPGFNIGFDGEALRQSYEGLLTQMFSDPSSPDPSRERFGPGDTAIVSTMVAMTTYLAQVFFEGFAGVLKEMLVKAAPGG